MPFMTAVNYIASVQETLLEIFAGPEAATQLPGCANTFRLAPVLQLEPNPRRNPSEAMAARLLDAPPEAPGAAPAIMSSWRTLRWGRGLRALDDVDLAATLRVRTPTLQSVPGWMRGLLAFALRSGLRLIRDAPGTAAAREAVGWKLFLLAPRMLLSRLHGQARIPQLSSSEEQACSGRASGPSCCSRSGPWLGPDPAPPDSLEARGELRRWRTWENSRLRPVHYRRARECQSLKLFSNTSAAPGPSGCTNEHLRLLLDSEEDMQLLHHATQRLALADVAEVIATAPSTRGRGARRSRTVSNQDCRHSSGHSLAQYAAPIQEACSPHQFTLSTRSGTGSVVHALSVATELDPTATIVSVDG
ncbi:unnamed protein product [Effrenium voratum]|nr:unnamed protein product [Effrenium voratum]